jgi:hypothetical protein
MVPKIQKARLKKENRAGPKIIRSKIVDPRVYQEEIWGFPLHRKAFHWFLD